VIPKCYSNALSRGCRGKLETILGVSSTSLEESEDRIEKGNSRRKGEDRLFEGWANVRKTLYIIYEFSSHPYIILTIDVCRSQFLKTIEIAFPFLSIF